MQFVQLFAGFLQPVALGSAAVFALLVLVGLRSPHRSPAVVVRRPRR